MHPSYGLLLYSDNWEKTIEKSQKLQNSFFCENAVFNSIELEVVKAQD